MSFMLQSSYKVNVLEAGCDEAGRGCLAGPVVAAAVILHGSYQNSLLNDSKKLTPSRRDDLRMEIEHNALAWAVGYADNMEIDSVNILQASILAMHRALSMLVPQPENIIVDGNCFNSYKDIPYTCIVKGDSLFSSIAAASILAKTHRDEMIMKLHNKYPVYGWDKNKGYATRMHISTLKQYGPSDYHRKSFKLKSKQLNLNFKD